MQHARKKRENSNFLFFAYIRCRLSPKKMPRVDRPNRLMNIKICWEQFRQMMFQVLDPIPKKGSLCRQRDRKIPRESWKRWWLAGKREQMGRRKKQRKGDQCDFRLAFGCQKRSDCLWRHSMKKMKQIVLSNTLDTSTQIRYAHISSLFVVKSISYRTPNAHAILVLFTIFYLFLERYGG